MRHRNAPPPHGGRAGARGGEIVLQKNDINRYLVQAITIKNHQSVVEAQKESPQIIQREYRARKLREEREKREREKAILLVVKQQTMKNR